MFGGRGRHPSVRECARARWHTPVSVAGTSEDLSVVSTSGRPAAAARLGLVHVDRAVRPIYNGPKGTAWLPDPRVPLALAPFVKSPTNSAGVTAPSRAWLAALLPPTHLPGGDGYKRNLGRKMYSRGMRYVIPPKIAFLQVFFQIALLTTLLSLSVTVQIQHCTDTDTVLPR